MCINILKSLIKYCSLVFLLIISVMLGQFLTTLIESGTPMLDLTIGLASTILVFVSVCALFSLKGQAIYQAFRRVIL